MKNAGRVALGIGIFVGGALLIALFIHGGAWLATVVHPWLVRITIIQTGSIIFFFLPLALFLKTRTLSGHVIVISSYVYGLSLWVWGLLLTYNLWGAFAVFVGLLLFGGGVVPIAMLATLFHGMWQTFGELALLALLTFGCRLGGKLLVADENWRKISQSSRKSEEEEDL